VGRAADVVRGSGQGGEPDLQTAAKMVLYDWQRGRIPYFVPPPEAEERRGQAAEEEAPLLLGTRSCARICTSASRLFPWCNQVWCAEGGVGPVEDEEEGDEVGEGAKNEERVLREAAAAAATKQTRKAIPVLAGFYDAEDLGEEGDDDVNDDEDSGAEVRGCTFRAQDKLF
jgi:nuclear GTP-binding protein